jgi:AraC family transcriptional activator of pobA
MTSRTPSHYDKRRLLDALDSYLRSCYRLGTAARVGEFAQVLGRSRPHISRVYRAVTGRTVRALMRERQVLRAEQLLRSGNRPTAEIAVLSAFGTQATLHRVFLALRGMTPQEYRENITK